MIQETPKCDEALARLGACLDCVQLDCVQPKVGPTGCTHHVGLSVRHAIARWGRSDWELAAKYSTASDGTDVSADDLKAAYCEWLAKGIEMIPIGTPCEGFSYQTGCPGHPW